MRQTHIGAGPGELHTSLCITIWVVVGSGCEKRHALIAATIGHEVDPCKPISIIAAATSLFRAWLLFRCVVQRVASKRVPQVRLAPLAHAARSLPTLLEE